MPVPTVFLDRHLPGLTDLLPPGVRAVPFQPGAEWTALRGEAARADALFIRTVTRITPREFPELEAPGRRLRFIASATAGVDHVDLAWLDALGITFAHAPGCNARAVAEYVAVNVLDWLWASGRVDPAETADPEAARRAFGRWTVGLLGAGHAGSATGELLRGLGFAVRLHDPPRESRDPGFHSCGWREWLASDILSLHVPLVAGGPHPTSEILDREALSTSAAQLVIQASRGGTLVERAITDIGAKLDTPTAPGAGAPDLVCDVWEGEPVFADRTAERARIATPHIAGYSVEGKWRASQMVAQAYARHLGVEAGRPKDAAPGGTAEKRPEAHYPFKTKPEPDDPRAVLAAIHPFRTYDAALRQWIGAPAERKGREFAAIRNTFALRREFAAMRCGARWLERYPFLQALGLREQRQGEREGEKREGGVPGPVR